jgi:hypothetical protein
MKKTIPLLVILTMLLVSCNGPKPDPDNGQAKVPLAPIDVYIFIEAKKVPLEGAEISCLGEDGSSYQVQTNTCGMVIIKKLDISLSYKIEVTAPDGSHIESDDFKFNEINKFTLP